MFKYFQSSQSFNRSYVQKIIPKLKSMQREIYHMAKRILQGEK